MSFATNSALATPIDLFLIERLSDKARTALQKSDTSAKSQSDDVVVDLRDMVRFGRGAATERAVFRTSRTNLFRDIFSESSEGTKISRKDHYHAAINAFTLI